MPHDSFARPSVLVLTQFHTPEPCAAANRVAALEAALHETGFDVHVITAVPSFPSGSIAATDRVRFWVTAKHEQIRVTRVWTYASTTLSGLTRLLNWLSVAAAMTFYVLTRRRRYDFVLVTLPPITLALPALVAAILYRARLVVDVRDVFPDVAIKMGYWSANGPAARIVGAISATLYRSAALVIAVTDSGRAEILARGSHPEWTIVASNGFDPVGSAPISPYQKQPEEFVAIFVGNMGLATGCDVILDAAAELAGEGRIRFVLAGGGADQERLATRVKVERLANVVMLGVVPRDEANALLAAADVSVIPLRRSIVDSLPTKLFDALALGTPVICCAAGEAREFVERSGGGIAIPPEDGSALAAALRVLFGDGDLRKRYATQGRAYVLEHYDRSAIMRSLAARLLSMLPEELQVGMSLRQPPAF